jgi:hypothetical protein
VALFKKYVDEKCDLQYPAGAANYQCKFLSPLPFLPIPSLLLVAGRTGTNFNLAY